MYLSLAKKIPDRVRSERLMTDADPIENSSPTAANSNMMLLFAIYTEFLFPGKNEDRNCWKCLQRIQHCFEQMKPQLVELERQYKLLKGIRK